MTSQTRDPMFPSFAERRMRVLDRLAIDQVLDVGANTGQWGRELRQGGWSGSLVSFEPLTEPHQELVRSAAGDRSWRIARPMAVGSSNEHAELRVAGNSISSSLLPMLDRHLRASPDSAEVDRQPVDVRRLDALAADWLDGDRLYLKIDTQGSELEVLEGADGIFDRLFAIEVELSLVPLYGGQPLAWELIHWLEQRGFGCFGIRPGFSDPETSRMLQMDGIFTRVDGDGISRE